MTANDTDRMHRPVTPGDPPPQPPTPPPDGPPPVRGASPGGDAEHVVDALLRAAFGRGERR